MAKRANAEPNHVRQVQRTRQEDRAFGDFGASGAGSNDNGRDSGTRPGIAVREEKAASGSRVTPDGHGRVVRQRIYNCGSNGGRFLPAPISRFGSRSQTGPSHYARSDSRSGGLDRRACHRPPNATAIRRAEKVASQAGRSPRVVEVRPPQLVASSFIDAIVIWHETDLPGRPDDVRS
jgi:hypothetical protein